MSENGRETTPSWSARDKVQSQLFVGVGLFILGNITTVTGWYDGMGFILFVPCYVAGFAFLVSSCQGESSVSPNRRIRGLIFVACLLSVVATFSYMVRYSTPPVGSFPDDELASNNGQ